MWTLNGIRIFVQENRGEGGQILPRLQPLEGQTIIQVFGYESKTKTINAIVVGDTDKDALMNLRKTGTAYELVSPRGSMGDFLVRKANYQEQRSLCQTMRPDLPEDAPVYLMDFELYPESD